MSFSQPSYYVYKEKVNIKKFLCGLDMYMNSGETNDQFFYFFDIENKKITLVQNRNMVYTYNFSKVSIKNNVLVFKIKEDDKSVSIFVDLNNHIFKYLSPTVTWKFGQNVIHHIGREVVTRRQAHAFKPYQIVFCKRH